MARFDFQIMKYIYLFNWPKYGLSIYSSFKLYKICNFNWFFIFLTCTVTESWNHYLFFPPSLHFYYLDKGFFCQFTFKFSLTFPYPLYIFWLLSALNVHVYSSNIHSLFKPHFFNCQILGYLVLSLMPSLLRQKFTAF